MRKFLYILSFSTFFLGSFFIYKSFDKKMNYREPRYSSNAYVGGDAYNYIINSNYFTGYNVLGMGCYVITALCLTSSAILKSLDAKQEQSKQFYEFIYQHPMFTNSGTMNKKVGKQKDTEFSVREWGKLPNFPIENADQTQSTQKSNTTNSESSQSQVNYSSLPNVYQVQTSQYHSYFPQKGPNEQWSRLYSQNPESNQPISNINHGQNFGNLPTPNFQGNSSRLQDNSTNMG